jgi:hypothetical protein
MRVEKVCELKMIKLLFIIIILIAIYVVLLAQGKIGIDILLISFGAKKRRPVNISHLQIPPSAKLQATITTLTNLGFYRLGEIRLRIVGVGSFESWIFISSDNLTHTGLTEAMANLVVFETVYKDHAVVETGFPMGENIERPNFRSHTITVGIEDAYTHHVQQITEFIKAHGIPRRIENMNDYLYWDASYRKLYVRRKFSRDTWFALMMVLASGYGLITTLLMAGFWLQWDNLTITRLHSHLVLLAKMVAPAAIVAQLIPFIALWSSRRESKAT